jgi:2-C-methyl-D-erythritol 4-phosphate cytidylyltransferase
MFFNNKVLDRIVLIVAGGSGIRMKSLVPKQFHLIMGQPVLMHTIRAFHDFDPSLKITVVIHDQFIRHWKELCSYNEFFIPHQVIAGGKNRFESVKKGLQGIKPGCLVAVHDGVRPLVSQDTIGRCFETAFECGNAVPCIEIKESIRKIEKDGSNMQAERRNFRIIQTPQVFESSLLINAYESIVPEEITDDAGLVEKSGCRIYLVKGNEENIKITHPHDLIIAEALFRQHHSS